MKSGLRILGVLILILTGVVLVAAKQAGASTMGMSWPHNGRSWPYIVVQNDTHTSDFPVKTAVKRWGTPLHYGRCVANRPCVHVVERHWGHDGISGLTPIGHYSSRIVNSTVELNRYYMRHGQYAGNYGYELQTVMHELGHSMGLDHDTGSGCMRAAISGRHTHVSSLERYELRQLYGMD